MGIESLVIIHGVCEQVGQDEVHNKVGSNQPTEETDARETKDIASSSKTKSGVDLAVCKSVNIYLILAIYYFRLIMLQILLKFT